MALFPDITCDDIFRLETTHLWLRWLRATDSAALTTIASHPDVAQMTATIPHPYPPGEAERFILCSRAATASGDALILAVTHKAKSQPLVGVVSAQAGDDGHDLEIGYMIAPGSTGRGFATEAAGTLVDAIFNLTETRVLSATSRVVNPASRRVLEKCGFSYLKTDLKLLPARGGLHSCDFLALDRRLWASRPRGIPRLPPMAHQRQRGEPSGRGERAE